MRRMIVIAALLLTLCGCNDDAVYYRSCSEARAACVTPLQQGQPGYRAALDQDHDGTACEVES